MQCWNSTVACTKYKSIKGRKMNSKSTKLTPLSDAKLGVSGHNRLHRWWGWDSKNARRRKTFSRGFTSKQIVWDINIFWKKFSVDRTGATKMRPNWNFFDFQLLAKFDRKEVQSCFCAVVVTKLQSTKGREMNSKSTKPTPLGGAKVGVLGPKWTIQTPKLGFLPHISETKRTPKEKFGTHKLHYKASFTA